MYSPKNRTFFDSIAEDKDDVAVVGGTPAVGQRQSRLGRITSLFKSRSTPAQQRSEVLDLGCARGERLSSYPGEAHVEKPPSALDGTAAGGIEVIVKKECLKALRLRSAVYMALQQNVINSASSERIHVNRSMGPYVWEESRVVTASPNGCMSPMTVFSRSSVSGGDVACAPHLTPRRRSAGRHESLQSYGVRMAAGQRFRMNSLFSKQDWVTRRKSQDTSV
ncbi:hypothetical protein KC328_g97 [Hortaea werneckii]|nr:hypothetical protein KC328_g97 [Hortaea werneckii]